MIIAVTPEWEEVPSEGVRFFLKMGDRKQPRVTFHHSRDSAEQIDRGVDWYKALFCSIQHLHSSPAQPFSLFLSKWVRMPSAPPAERFTGRAVAQVGNAVALFAICLVLANCHILFKPTAPPEVSAPHTERVQRVVLIVIDGLRADALNSGDTPHIRSLANRGSFTTSVVGALVPSTVAGLRALIEGVIAPPAGFVNDFRSRRAPHGGLIETVHASGGRVFTAGPRLWTDLYGDWIDGSLSVFGLARDDPTVLRAARVACADPQWKLVIVQFCRPDVMAHLHGGNSAEYAASIRWCDKAVDDLTHAAGNDALVVVTSDHGVTSAGGHAGTESAVVETPLVINRASVASGLREVPQARVPQMIATAMGLVLAQDLSVQAMIARPPFSTLACLAAAFLGMAAMFRLLGSAVSPPPPERAAFWLNIAVWVSLAAAWLNPSAACIFSLGVLLVAAFRFSDRTFLSIGFVFAAGIALGAVRVGAAWLTSASTRLSPPSALTVIAVCALALVLGYIGGTTAKDATLKRLIWIGSGVAALAPGLTALLGESVSLSTLDVRLAFRLINTPFGLPGAVLLAALLPFLPALLMVLGLVLNWRHAGDSRSKLAPVAAGAGAVIAGELAVAAVILSGSNSQHLSSLALGLLIRECAHVTVLFPAVAMAVLLVPRARAQPFS
ncbi:alkaline phosphatase family protein [Verrucomicrobiota bacterium sgz303538]